MLDPEGTRSLRRMRRQATLSCCGGMHADLTTIIIRDLLATTHERFQVKFQIGCCISGSQICRSWIWNECTVIANVTVECKSDMVRSNKQVNKTTSGEDVQQYTKLENANSDTKKV